MAPYKLSASPVVAVGRALAGADAALSGLVLWTVRRIAVVSPEMGARWDPLLT